MHYIDLTLLVYFGQYDPCQHSSSILHNPFTPTRGVALATARKTSIPPIFRFAHPLAFAAFLRHIGAPVERYLRCQGLPTLCNDPNAFVPLNKAWSFFNAAARHEDLMLGWHVGRFVGDHNLNHKLLRQLENAPTLYQALHQLVKMVSSEASHLQIGVLERSQDILFYTHYTGRREEPGYMTSQAYQLEVYMSLIRHFVGKQWVPPEIGFEYPTSSPVVEEYFPGSQIFSGQEMGYIAVPRSVFHKGGRGPNAGGIGEAGLALSKDFDYVDTLRALLKTYLAEGYLSEQFAASLMDTSVRTLTRRVSDHGLTYGSLIDDIRFNAAREMLQTPGMKILHVARSVGFEDHSDFTRMFRRVGGLTPREFRKASQSD